MNGRHNIQIGDLYIDKQNGKIVIVSSILPKEVKTITVGGGQILESSIEVVFICKEDYIKVFRRGTRYGETKKTESYWKSNFKRRYELLKKCSIVIKDGQR